MNLNILGIDIKLGMPYEEIPLEKRKYFKITNLESSEVVLLRIIDSIIFKGRLFSIKLKFKRGKLIQIDLDGKQGNPNFYEVHEEDKKWLHENFGKPMEKKQWGAIYNFDNYRIIAEVDPRGMDAQISFRLIQHPIVFEINSIDAIGIVDNHLELLLIDPNEWLPDTEHDHLLKLQEKINNYIHYLESKQYVEHYGDDFTEKVIRIEFQYSPSDNCLAFLVQVQKILQPADMRLKVVVPD